MKMNLKKKIIALAVLPALILGIASIVIALTTVKDSLIDEIQDSLQGTAAAALAAYDQNSGEYMMAENGDVWKGSYNISKSENLVDNIKSKSGMDVTFFYGKTRIMTSAMDDDGNRILASEAGDKIIKTVLEGGEEYFSKAVSLDGNLNYGYYMPVYQKGSTSEIIGMIFVGTDKSRKDAAINKIIWMIIISVILVMVLCVLASVLVSISISRSLREGIGIVQTVAKGELGVEISKKLLTRKDEVGDLSQSIYTLQKELKHILKQIAEGTEKLTEASEELGITARTTNRTMQQVEQAVGHHIDFISKDCFTETIQWNTTNNNNGDSTSPYPYMVSNLKKWLDETLYGYLPDKVKNQIAHKRMLLEQRYSSAGALTDSTSWGWQDLGALWVPLEYEVFGAIVWGTPGWSEGQAVQYPIFANTYLSRIKGAGNGGSRCSWWLASVGSGSSTYACHVYLYGSASNWNASNSPRVPVCFRITA